MKILVVSDNHGNREVLEKVLSNEVYDISIHLGDSEMSEDWISKNFTHYVGGNHDFYSIYEKTIDIGKLTFAFCHGHTIGVNVFNIDKPVVKFGQRKDADVVLYGHTHIFNNQHIDDVQIICPGSLTLSRGPEGNGYCVITIEDDQVKQVEFKSLTN